MIDVDTLAPRGFPQQLQPTVPGGSADRLKTGTQRTTSQPAQRHPDMLSLSPQQILARNTRSQTRRDAEHMSRSEPNTEGAARTCSQPCSQPNTEGAARGAALDGIFLEERARDY